MTDTLYFLIQYSGATHHFLKSVYGTYEQAVQARQETLEQNPNLLISIYSLEVEHDSSVQFTLDGVYVDFHARKDD